MSQSLLSGTAIKSVFAYVTDYITKSSLKTHTMFEAIQAVLERNAQYLNGDASQHDKAHKLMVQMVNAMSAKMEMGGPMACMYLLGHEDHYTSHSFKTFFWKGYVNQVRNTWEKEDAMKRKMPWTLTVKIM